MNQMERIAKIIVTEPDPEKRKMMKIEINRILKSPKVRSEGK